MIEDLGGSKSQHKNWLIDQNESSQRGNKSSEELQLAKRVVKSDREKCIDTPVSTTN